MLLNARALELADAFVADAELLRLDVHEVAGTRVIDCGAKTAGGLEAGRRLAEICLAGLGSVAITPGDSTLGALPAVSVRTDHPVAACMASQYAGWEIQGENYFAMGSGPMRAAAGREPLFDDIGHCEKPDACVGVLETHKRPTEAICQGIAEKCGVASDKLSLFYAPTNSLAGNLQVVARSVETALHKLHELNFDLARVQGAWGVAPLPPVAGDALTGVGRTNDAILYGGHAVLCVTGDDASLTDVGPKTPSAASTDHGRPFQEVFAAYDHDFYKIDKLLFSPARVTFVNIETGNSHTFGQFGPDVLAKSVSGFFPHP